MLKIHASGDVVARLVGVFILFLPLAAAAETTTGVRLGFSTVATLMLSAGSGQPALDAADSDTARQVLRVAANTQWELRARGASVVNEASQSLPTCLSLMTDQAGSAEQPLGGTIVIAQGNPTAPREVLVRYRFTRSAEGCAVPTSVVFTLASRGQGATTGETSTEVFVPTSSWNAP